MRNRLVVLLAAGAIIASACGSSASPAPASAPPATTPAAASAEAPSTAASPSAPAEIDITTTTYKPEAVGNSGGKLLFGISGEPTSLWYGTYDNFANNVDAFGPALWSLWNNTSDFKYYGQLASSVPTTGNGGVTVTPSGGMDVKVELIPGALWSDGQPITCADLEYMWHWTLDKAQVGLVAGITGWEDIAAIDGGTGTSCVVHFSKIYEQYLSMWAPLLPAHYLKTVSVKDAQLKLYTHGKAGDVASGVYSGPYIPQTWTAGAQIDYVPNAKFWDTIKKSKAPFDSATFKFYGDAQTEIAGFTANEVDVALEFNHTHLPLLDGVPKESVDVVDGLTYEHNSYNLKSLTDKYGADGAKALMEAIHYGYDKDTINMRVLSGTATPSCNFTSPLAWSYADIPCYKYDPAKANQILDDAGFTKGSDGVRVAPAGSPTAGKPVELVACTRADRQYRIDTLRLVGTQMEALGIKFNLDHVATDRAIIFSPWEGPDAAPPDAPCNLTRGNFDVTEFAWVPTPDPTSAIFNYLSTYDPSLGDHSGQNYTRVNNADLDGWLKDMVSTVDLHKIKDDMAKIQALYVDPANAFPEIALYNWRSVLLKSPQMHNISNNSTAATQSWNIEDWWRAAQ
jgi:peptide/nickel transport system substrate-binding protein